MTLNKKERKSAVDNAFLERVALVFFFIGTALLSTAYLWNYFGEKWFEIMMQDPSSHQYSLPFSLVLHVPALVSMALGLSFMANGLLLSVSIKLCSVLIGIGKRCKTWRRKSQLNNDAHPTEITEKGGHTL